jgi:hypothetical protein
MRIRVLHWLVAIVGLAIPLVATDFAAWAVVALWLLVLAVIRFVKPLEHASRSQRITLAVVSLPVLVLAATLFGLFLVPAAAAWLLIELISPSPAVGRSLEKRLTSLQAGYRIRRPTVYLRPRPVRSHPR